MRGEVCGPAESVRCGRCGRVCSIEAWLALPTVATFGWGEVAGHVSEWPRGDVVEVRACGGCGGAVARRRRSAVR
jgi:hypothetical protein